MKKAYFALSVLGFLAPSMLMLKVTFETGNILLLTDPNATIIGAFANDISSPF